MWNEGDRIDYCKMAIKNLSGVETTGIAGINDNGDVEKLIKVFLVFPWKNEAVREKWFIQTFKDRPGDLLWLMSLARHWKEMGFSADKFAGDLARSETVSF